MKLEIISRLPEGGARRPPLLFVHGVFGAAWVWDEYFLPWFAARGFPAYALSLRGHGASEGRERVALASLDDYTEDVASAVGLIGEAPILIGHSMGGAIVQNYLRHETTPGAVLMASVPPHGLLASSLTMAATNPLLYYEMMMATAFGPGAVPPRAVRRALFAGALHSDLEARFFATADADSRRIGFDLMGWRPLAPPADRAPPMLVVGAEKDGMVSAAAVEATARAYGTAAITVPGMAHAMMLEPNWQAAAEPIRDWADGLT
jgi:pimeloyl-ACP methyl ester carboxylesterase